MVGYSRGTIEPASRPYLDDPGAVITLDTVVGPANYLMSRSSRREHVTSVDPTAIADELFERNILISDGADDVTLSDAFVSTIRARQSELADVDGDAIESRLRDVTGSVDMLPLSEHGSGVVALLATYEAVAEFLPHFDDPNQVRIALLLDQLGDTTPPAAGAPAVFFPVSGTRLPLVLALFRSAIVYVWRDDCPPCDDMRKTFDEVFDAPPPDVLLLAVYGPDAQDLLRDEYDVGGAPTTLFVHQGRVDARLIGAHPPMAITAEVETFRRLADGATSSPDE